MNEKCLHPYYKEGVYFKCGQCLSCKIARSREWTIRLLHEGLYHPGQSHFLTLTYDSNHIPKQDGRYTLDHKDVQDFVRRIRDTLTGCKIKYLMCGEYGPKTGRPHYHMILYGLTSVEVKEYIDTNPQTCTTGNKLWRNGFVYVGYNFTPETCAYVAQYTLKKMRMEDYKGIRKPPYIVASKGIGKNYAKNNQEKMLKDGCIHWQEHTYNIPRYYFKVLDIDRGLYYAQQIQKCSERLVLQMVSQHIQVFSDAELAHTQTIKDVLWLDEWRQRAYKAGRIMWFDGQWRVLTKKALNYIDSLRLAHNAKIKNRIRGIREKL